jgi:hypothetical protein
MICHFAWLVSFLDSFESKPKDLFYLGLARLVKRLKNIHHGAGHSGGAGKKLRGETWR